MGGPGRRPELAVVLVDCDDHLDRRKLLLEHVTGIVVPRAIGVPVQEFEAWLVADEVAVRAACGRTVPKAPGPEGMKPGEAKQLLGQWLASVARPSRATDVSFGGRSPRAVTWMW